MSEPCTCTATAPSFKNSCPKRADASGCTTYRPPLQMRGIHHTHGVDHTECNAQSPRSRRLRLREINHNPITNIYILRSGIGNRSTQENMNIIPGLEVDNEIQTDWRRIPYSSKDATRLTEPHLSPNKTSLDEIRCIGLTRVPKAYRER